MASTDVLTWTDDNTLPADAMNIGFCGDSETGEVTGAAIMLTVNPPSPQFRPLQVSAQMDLEQAEATLAVFQRVVRVLKGEEPMPEMTNPLK